MTARHPTVRLVGRVGLSRRLVMVGSAPIARSHRPICLGRPAPGSRDRPLGSLRCSFRCRFSARRLSRRPRVSRAAPSSGTLAGCQTPSPAAAPPPLGPGPTPPPPPAQFPAPLQARGTSHVYTRSEKLEIQGKGEMGPAGTPCSRKSGAGNPGMGPRQPVRRESRGVRIRKSEPVMEWKATAPVSGCPRSLPASDSAAGSRC